MGLRCLVGHDYGTPETEQERSDEGDEVVVTVREYKECNRCGHRQLISENTEVKSSTTSDSVVAANEEPQSGASITDESDEFEDMSAEEDDGVILDDEDPSERGRGEWPEKETEQAAADTDEEESAESGETADSDSDEGDDWPEHEQEDEGFTAGPADSSDTGDVEFGGGLTPERAQEQEGSGDMIEAEAGGSGIRREGSGPTPTARQHELGADMETEYACPECDFTSGALRSSLRPGDICPECQAGYLMEQERE